MDSFHTPFDHKATTSRLIHWIEMNSSKYIFLNFGFNSAQIYINLHIDIIAYLPSSDDEHTPQLWKYFAFSNSFVPQLWQNISKRKGIDFQ